jgi:ParB-like chromosome segregation protein Spo0J
VSQPVSPFSPVSDAAPARLGTRVSALHAPDVSPKPVAVSLLSLLHADSPRLNGEDKAHIARLAQIETPLPPILVDRRTMRVIDGMHRLMAASLQGRETIDVLFYEGTEDDIFLRAVEENVTHGLPLSQADRRAAAERIIASHGHMSDRAIGQTAGLAAKTVAAIRKGLGVGAPQSSSRVGRDGKVRPLDGGIGRLRAAEVLASQPETSLRDVARAAGISPATALDVRKRLERGESPVLERPAGQPSPATAASDDATTDREAVEGGASTRAHDGNAAVSSLSFKPKPTRATVPANPAATVEKLMRDPSLRNTERGKGMLRLLHVNAVSAAQMPDVAATVPAHCVTIVVQLAYQYANMWQDFARELDGRARILDPAAGHSAQP